MRLQGFISPGQCATIHRNALRVLAEVGVKVEHAGMRKRLTRVGGRTDAGTDVVRFPKAKVEKLIRPSKKRVSERPIRVGAHVEAYRCRHLAPDGKLEDFTEDKFVRYFGLADSLPGVNSTVILGLPFVPDGIPPICLPLAEKLYGWKYGVGVGGAVHVTALCEYLLEIFQVHAAATGRKLEDVFAASGFLISPLRLNRSECEQYVFFAERGLRMSIGNMPSLGGSAPVTVAGTAVQALAEQMFAFLLKRAYWDEGTFGPWGPALALDMRSGVPTFGRPEQTRVNLVFADLARFYGTHGGGLAGLTDALAPSYEAGIHKATGVLTVALATGASSVSAGLLAVDKVCSPVQMVLDHDLVGGLNSLCAAAEVSEKECAFAEIAEVGFEPGGHLATEFTVEVLRRGRFAPRTWSSAPDRAFQCDQPPVDVDRAREFVVEFDRSFSAKSLMGESEEKEIRGIIGRAAARVEGSRC